MDRVVIALMITNCQEWASVRRIVNWLEAKKIMVFTKTFMSKLDVFFVNNKQNELRM